MTSLLERYRLELRARGWDEGKHPRDPVGESGGQWVKKGSSSSSSSSRPRSIDDWMQRHPDVDTWAHENESGIILDQIRITDPAHRGQGKATAALEDLLAYADATGQKVALTVGHDPQDRGLSKSAKVEWYRRHGFVPNKGRNKDFAFTETMIRLPKGERSRARGGEDMTETAVVDVGGESPPGDVRLRSAELVGVSFPERTIELIVTPYEQEALVPMKGRLVTEIFSRGAYDGIERRANRIRVNRDHVRERTVGRAVALYPSRQEGLVALVRIARTELGDETLALADDDCLDVSAGYLPMDGGEQWESRNRVRIRRAWLGHIALTPEPAYEGARILAVRSGSQPAEPALSNREKLELEEARRLLADIDSRYGLKQS